MTIDIYWYMLQRKQNVYAPEFDPSRCGLESAAHKEEEKTLFQNEKF